MGSMLGRLLGLAALVGCGAEIEGGSNTPVDAATSDTAMPLDDAGVDAPPTDAAPLGPWSMPALVPGANGAGNHDDATPTSNTLELVFGMTGSDGNKHLYYMSRPTAAANTWSTPSLLPFNQLGTGQTEQTPRFSADDTTLYFTSSRNGSQDIFMVTRPAAGSTTWGTPQPLSEVNDPDDVDKWFSPCAGGRYLLISERDGNSDVYEGALGTTPPTRVATFSTAASELGAFITNDCLTAYWASETSGDFRIYRSTRTSVTSAWSQPAMVTDFGPMTAGLDQEDPWLAPDGRTFVLVDDRVTNGDKDVYISTR